MNKKTLIKIFFLWQKIESINKYDRKNHRLEWNEKFAHFIRWPKLYKIVYWFGMY